MNDEITYLSCKISGPQKIIIIYATKPHNFTRRFQLFIGQENVGKFILPPQVCTTIVYIDLSGKGSLKNVQLSIKVSYLLRIYYTLCDQCFVTQSVLGFIKAQFDNPRFQSLCIKDNGRFGSFFNKKLRGRRLS